MRSLLFLPLCLVLAACGGGGADNEMHNMSVSKGQQLIDLQKAKDSGVISSDEYDDQREDILDEDY